MLSSLVVTKQKCITIRDDLGDKDASEEFITQLLKEQGEDATIKILPVGPPLSCLNTLEKFLSDYNVEPEEEGILWNIILPNLSDFMAYQEECMIFTFLHELKRCRYVKRIFLWVSTPYLEEDNVDKIMDACEHLSELVLHIMSTNELTILKYEPSFLTFNLYTYIKTDSEIKVQLCEIVKKEDAQNSDQPSTSRRSDMMMTTRIPMRLQNKKLKVYGNLDKNI